MKTEITPLLIITKLEQYDYDGATALAVGPAARLLPAALSHERRAVVGAPALGRDDSLMAGMRRGPGARGRDDRPGGRLRSRLARWTMLGVALLFLGVVLVVPLVLVFATAFEKGWLAYATALRDPDAWAAVRLTLFVSVVTLPLNTMFGLAAGWSIGKL